MKMFIIALTLLVLLGPCVIYYVIKSPTTEVEMSKEMAVYFDILYSE